MIDWYYHDPGVGRVGPFSADELRKRFHDRRIQRDTLVWHHGLREWQPLQGMAEDLGLDLVQHDASQPPPLPSPAPQAAALPPHIPVGTTASTAGTVSRGKYSRTPLRSKKTLSSGAILGIVSCVLAIPALLLFASIALPAYRDYAQRLEAPELVGQSIAIQRHVERHLRRTGRCPTNETRGFDVMRQVATRAKNTAALNFMTMDDGTCGFELTLHNLGADADGKTLLFESFVDDNELAWDCTGGTLPEAYRPWKCRASSYEE